jgi:hypothetical protein
MGNSTLSLTGPTKDINEIVEYLLWQSRRRKRRGYPEVGWDFESVPPDPKMYITRDSNLSINYLSFQADGTITVSYKILDPNGKIVYGQQSFAVASTGQLTRVQFSLVEGFLLSVGVQIYNAGTRVLRGDCFVQVGLSYTTAAVPQPFKMLISDYVTTMCSLGWPDGGLHQSVEGYGCIYSQSNGAPLAGADIFFTTPAYMRTRLHSVSATLVTSVAVANRIPTFTFYNSNTQIVWALGPPAAQTAGKTVVYNLGEGVAMATDASGNVTIPLPAEFWFANGACDVATVTTNIQAADQWSTSKFVYECWAEE